MKHFAVARWLAPTLVCLLVQVALFAQKTPSVEPTVDPLPPANPFPVSLPPHPVLPELPDSVSSATVEELVAWVKISGLEEVVWPGQSYTVTVHYEAPCAVKRGLLLLFFNDKQVKSGVKAPLFVSDSSIARLTHQIVPYAGNESTYLLDLKGKNPPVAEVIQAIQNTFHVIRIYEVLPMLSGEKREFPLLLTVNKQLKGKLHQNVRLPIGALWVPDCCAFDEARCLTEFAALLAVEKPRLKQPQPNDPPDESGVISRKHLPANSNLKKELERINKAGNPPLKKQE